jgi:ankyrin repeat protein
LAEPGEDANEVLEFLVETFPASIEKKNTEGDTPLMVACRLGRIEAIKILLSANADQSARNQKGENILHAALACNPKDHQLRELLDLIDTDLRSHLFLQKKNLAENGTTPLHAWVSQASGVQPDNANSYHRYNYHGYRGAYNGKEQEMIQMLNLLLEYSKGDELEMLNGAGDTCLHTAIMMDMIPLTQALIKFRPSLVYRENAVGRTPAELAHDRLTSQKFEVVGSPSRSRKDGARDTLDSNPENFVRDVDIEAHTPEQRKEFLETLGLSDNYKANEVSLIRSSMGVKKHPSNKSLNNKTTGGILWDLCRTAMQKYPGKRRLVTLNEANDVAKRLGEKYSASRYFSVQARVEDGEEDPEENENNTTVDFAVQEMNSRLSRAWYINEQPTEENSSSASSEI